MFANSTKKHAIVKSNYPPSNFLSICTLNIIRCILIHNITLLTFLLHIKRKSYEMRSVLYNSSNLTLDFVGITQCKVLLIQNHSKKFILVLFVLRRTYCIKFITIESMAIISGTQSPKLLYLSTYEILDQMEARVVACFWLPHLRLTR